MDKINIEDFQRLDLRIGTIVSAEVPKWSHWVMKLTVDFGDPPAGGGEKTIFAGIMKFFEPKELIGNQYPFIINLAPKKIGPEGDESEGMMIMIVPKEDEKTAPILFKITKKVPNGAMVG